MLLSRALMVLAAAAATATAAQPQDNTAQRAYFRAVAGYFQVPESEIAILAHGGDIAADEIPVVLFVARRGGVSAEAVAALRESGRSWTELAQRFGVGANALHVPISDPASAGVLSAAYQRFHATPMQQWSNMRLESEEIVALVNVRVLSQALGVEPDAIARRSGSTASFVELYGQFLR
jgi:transposase-like protein